MAQKYIDQSKNMKQRASDVLSLGGLQTDQDGQQLRKRKANNEPEQISTNSKTMSANVYNITFNNCNNTNFNLPNMSTDKSTDN